MVKRILTGVLFNHKTFPSLSFYQILHQQKLKVFYLLHCIKSRLTDRKPMGSDNADLHGHIKQRFM